MDSWQSHQQGMQTIRRKSEASFRRTKCTDRVGSETPAEIIPDRVHGGSDRGLKEPCNLRSERVKAWILDLESNEYDSPCQCQPPGPNPILSVMVPRGTKFDVLGPLIIRKNSLHPLVKFLRKQVQVFGGVEFRASQLLWVWVE